MATSVMQHFNNPPFGTTPYNIPFSNASITVQLWPWSHTFQIFDASAAAFSAISGLNVYSQQFATTRWPSSSTPITLRNLFYGNFHGQVTDQIFYIPDSEYDPSFDFDFTSYDPQFKELICSRGNYPYTRPSGWYRKGVKAKGKYENDVWLGPPVWRDYSSPGEWWVSYHGTKRENISNIVLGGYDINKSLRQKYGPGIYSTPNPKVAEFYAQPFLYNGEWYKGMLQNRVNPCGTIPIISDLGDGIYFKNPNQYDIRPYGVCIKKIYSCLKVG